MACFLVFTPRVVATSGAARWTWERLSPSPNSRLCGRLFGWGWNAAGELGVRDLRARYEPWLVPKLRGSVLQVACGLRHTLFLTDSTVLAAGDSTYGALGQAGAANRSVTFIGTPQPVDFSALRFVVEGPPDRVIHRAVRVCASFRSSFCVTEKGRVVGWGANVYGEVGNGKVGHTKPTWCRGPDEYTDGRGMPKGDRLRDSGTAIPGYHVVQIDAGDYWCMVLTQSNEVYTWGLGKHGRLGTGSTACSVCVMDAKYQLIAQRDRR